MVRKTAASIKYDDEEREKIMIVGGRKGIMMMVIHQPKVLLKKLNKINLFLKRVLTQMKTI